MAIILPMSLKLKLALFIAAAGWVFSLSYVWLNHLTITHSGVEQKHITTRKVASRVAEMVENEKKRIATICFDWAAWDMMYDYAEKPTREFESQSMPAAVIPEYDLNVLMVINRGNDTLDANDNINRRCRLENWQQPIRGKFVLSIIECFGDAIGVGKQSVAWFQ